MNKRVISGAAAVVFLACTSAWADEKSDADKMYAEWSAIPDGTVTPAVADALAFETQNSFAPKLLEVVYEMPAQRPAPSNSYSDTQGYFYWTERAKLTQIAPNLFKLEFLDCVRGYGTYNCGGISTLITDRTGLIVPYRKTGPVGLINGQMHYDDTYKMSALAIGAPQPSSGASSALLFSSYTSTVVRADINENAVNREEYSCQIAVQEGQVDTTCKTSGIYGGSLNHDKIERLDPGSDGFSSTWNSAFNMYLPKDIAQPPADGCYEDVCDGHSHKIVDYRTGTGDWHSKVVSAALSLADRKKALALFSAGFDSYKTSDFVGAMALLQKGLTIDPANYLAYFTLAECARSAFTNNQNDYWERSVAFYYYRRTVDLAPDSPEGVRAQGRLDGGLK